MQTRGKQLLSVGIGGAAGALIREVLSHTEGVPPEISILFGNMLGCALIGLVLHIEHRLHPHVREFNAAGFCGGLTTVSGWSLVLVEYLEAGEVGQATFFAILGLTSGLLALLAGRLLAGGVEGILLRLERQP
jgi:CrcB protein